MLGSKRIDRPRICTIKRRKFSACNFKQNFWEGHVPSPFGACGVSVLTRRTHTTVMQLD